MIVRGTSIECLSLPRCAAHIRRTHYRGVANSVIPHARETDRGYLDSPKNRSNVLGTSMGCLLFLMCVSHVQRTFSGRSRKNEDSKKFKRPVDVLRISAKYRNRMNVRKTSIGCLLIPRCAAHIPWTSGGNIWQGSQIP